MTTPPQPGPPLDQQPHYPSTQAPRNGFGITALTLAIVGLVFGLVPLTGFLALILGALAVLFGLLGWARARRGEASNPRMAVTATALGAVSAALGIWGITIVFGAVDDLDRTLNGQGGVISGPAVAGDTVPASEVKQLTFGQSFTYLDGITVSVAGPVPYNPSSSAAISPNAARATAVKVTVTASESKPLDLLGVSVQATAGELEAREVYDFAKGMGGIPQQTLPPGKRQTFTAVFELPAEPAEFRVQVRPGWFGYEPVFFVGSA